jgi:hypothetical protein
MMKRFLPAAALALGLATPAAASLFVDSVDVYQIGDTRPGPGLDTLSWNHFYDGLGTPTFASLTIVAEGVDEDQNDPFFRENDQVYLNGTLLGLLDDQNFYYSFFDINPGPGALGNGQTELSTTVFVLNPALLVAGNNLVQIVVDPESWIMEAETSTLVVDRIDRTPEPSTLFLVAAGLLGLVSARRRKR